MINEFPCDPNKDWETWSEQIYNFERNLPISALKNIWKGKRKNVLEYVPPVDFPEGQDFSV